MPAYGASHCDGRPCEFWKGGMGMPCTNQARGMVGRCSGAGEDGAGACHAAACQDVQGNQVDDVAQLPRRRSYWPAAPPAAPAHSSQGVRLQLRAGRTLTTNQHRDFVKRTEVIDTEAQPRDDNTRNKAAARGESSHRKVPSVILDSRSVSAPAMTNCAGSQSIQEW